MWEARKKVYWKSYSQRSHSGTQTWEKTWRFAVGRTLHISAQCLEVTTKSKQKMSEEPTCRAPCFAQAASFLKQLFWSWKGESKGKPTQFLLLQSLKLHRCKLLLYTHKKKNNIWAPRVLLKQEEVAGLLENQPTPKPCTTWQYGPDTSWTLKSSWFFW